MKLSFAATLLHLVLAGLASAATARPLAAQAPLPPVEGEGIVKFKADAATARRFALAAGPADAAGVQALLSSRAGALGARVGRTLRAGSAVGERTQVMHASGVDAKALAAQLAADPEVEYAVPNGRRRILTAPNDPLYAATATGVRPSGPDSGQWYLRAPDSTIKSAIDIETAWLRSTGSGVQMAWTSGIRSSSSSMVHRIAWMRCSGLGSRFNGLSLWPSGW